MTGGAVEEEADGAVVGGAEDVAVAEQRSVPVLERHGRHVDRRERGNGGRQEEDVDDDEEQRRHRRRLRRRRRQAAHICMYVCVCAYIYHTPLLSGRPAVEFDRRARAGVVRREGRNCLLFGRSRGPDRERMVNR